MELVVISHPDKVKNEADIINHLFMNGLNKIHLRKPDWSLEQTISLIKQIEPAYRTRIALHQQHTIAIDLDIKHLHFKEKDRRGICREILDFLRESDMILSTSIHDLTEISSLKCFDYCFYGPVFNSISKVNYQGKLSDNFNLPLNKGAHLYAIGGICKENIHQVKNLGFDGVGVLGTIWEKPENAVNNFKELKKICN